MRSRVVLVPLTFLLGACAPESDVNRLNEAPTASILAPAHEALLRQGQGPAVAEGQVADTWDAAADLEVSWVLDGLPVPATPDAAGRLWLDVDLDALALGEHTLELEVLDSDGAWAGDLRDFTLDGPYAPPTVSILRPSEGDLFDVGENIGLLGEASDLTTPADLLSFAWTSSLDGPLSGSIDAKGQSALFLSTLSEGEHTITLTVTDTDGDQGQSTVTLQVGAGEPEIPEVEIEEDARPGDLVFSEMMINPEVVEDEVGEWVELYNTASYAVDVTGYSFHDDDYDRYVLAGPLIVQPGDYLVLCADLDPKKNGGVPCDGWFFRDYQGNGLALANKPDEVVLSRPDGVEIDWLHYDETWIVPAVAIGVAPEHRSGDDNDRLDHWCWQVTVMTSGGEPGTPGQDNDPCP